MTDGRRSPLYSQLPFSRLDNPMVRLRCMSKAEHDLQCPEPGRAIREPHALRFRVLVRRLLERVEQRCVSLSGFLGIGGHFVDVEEGVEKEREE